MHIYWLLYALKYFYMQLGLLVSYCVHCPVPILSLLHIIQFNSQDVCATPSTVRVGTIRLTNLNHNLPRTVTKHRYWLHWSLLEIV